MSSINSFYDKALAGDEQAEKELFQYLIVRFKSIARRRIGVEEYEDLAQEACKTVLEKYKKVTYTESFQQWAYGVLKNKIGSYLQGKLQKQKKSITETEGRPLFRSSPRESLVDLERQLIHCIKKIIKKNVVYARVLNLVYHGYTKEEICRRLRVEQSYLYVILNRGRNMLRKCLKTGGI